MKTSRSTRWWQQHLSFPRLTSRIFPPPSPTLPPVSSQQADEPEIVDLRDPAEQKRMCEEAKPFTLTSVEPWSVTILGCLIAAAIFILVLFVF